MSRKGLQVSKVYDSCVILGEASIRFIATLSRRMNVSDCVCARERAAFKAYYVPTGSYVIYFLLSKNFLLFIRNPYFMCHYVVVE